MQKMLGFFFAVILMLLIFLTVYIQKLDPFHAPIPMDIWFENGVEGLRSGDDVKVEGMLYGKVRKVELADQGGVMVHATLDRRIELYEGYEITVEALSLLGGNHVSIKRGKKDPAKKPLRTDVRLYGTAKPSAFDKLAELVSKNSDAVSSLLNNASDTFKELKKTAQNLNEGQGTVGALFKDRKLYDDAVATLGEAKQAIGDARTAMSDLRDKLNSTHSTLGKILNTSELHDEVVKDIRELTQKAREAVDEVKDIAHKVKEGEGPIPALLNDKEMRDNIKTTTANLKKISQDVEKLTDKTAKGDNSVGRLLQDEGELYKKTKDVVEGVDKVLGRAGRSKIIVYGNTALYSDSDVSISKLGIQIWPDDTKYFFVGGSFIGLSKDSEVVTFDKQINENEDDTLIKFDLGVMYRIPWFFDNHVGIKAGLLDGKPGGGIEIDFDLFDAYPIHFEFEIRDAYNSVDDEDFDENVRGPMTRAWLKLPLWPRPAPPEKGPDGKMVEKASWLEQVLHSIKVVGGAARLQDNPEWFVGIGFEFRDEDVKTLVGLLGAAK